MHRGTQTAAGDDGGDEKRLEGRGRGVEEMQRREGEDRRRGREGRRHWRAETQRRTLTHTHSKQEHVDTYALVHICTGVC